MGWGSHILAKRGPKRWPPEFFGNTCNCQCGPPPPPPLPYLAYAYSSYYGGVASEPCAICPGGRLATRWQIEISGYANLTPPAPCATSVGTQCTANNGTFILRPIASSHRCCRRVSPTFVGTGATLTNFGCGICHNSSGLYYDLEVCPDAGDPTRIGYISLWLVSITSGEGIALWTIPPADFNCMGSNTLTLDDSYHESSFGGLTICCDGAPASITLQPA
jgi:hypothetical protein